MLRGNHLGGILKSQSSFSDAVHYRGIHSLFGFICTLAECLLGAST